MGVLDRLRGGGWSAAAVFLAIAVCTMLVLILVLKKSNATHLTVGAALVMLMYLVIGAFLVLASRLFVPSRPPDSSR